MRYRFDVGYVPDKNSLMAGQPTAIRRVVVEADSPIDARLLAEQIVACTDEPVQIKEVLIAR